MKEAAEMIRISKKTQRLRPDLRKCIDHFFGKNGLGLLRVTPHEFCAYFEGGGGFVAVDIVDEEENRVVDIRTKEWEIHAQRFLETV